MKRLILALVFALSALPVYAQSNCLAVANAVADQGYFDRCAGGDMRACSLFARLVALQLNPGGDPNGAGWLTKSPGESNVDGYADDAIVFGQGQNNVYDLVGGSGAPGASVQCAGPFPRRPHNVWEAPRALSPGELAYLKPGGGIPPGPGPAPVPQPVNLQPLLDAIAALSEKVDGLEATIRGFGDSILPTVDAARIASESARDAAHEVKATAEDTRQRLELNVTNIDRVLQELAKPITCRGQARISGTLVLDCAVR